MTVKYSYNIAPFDEPRFRFDFDRTSIKVRISHISINDTVIDIYMYDGLDVDDKAILDQLALDHTGAPLEDEIPKTSRNIPKVAMYDPEGTSETFVSHDWTDPTTWYQESVRVENEVLTFREKRGVFKAKMSEENIINLTSGRITFEDKFSNEYTLEVSDESGPLEIDKHFEIDYQSGVVTLINDYSPSGEVIISFSYAIGSTFTLNVPEGVEQLKVKDAEIQFATNVVLNAPIDFCIYKYLPDNGWTEVFKRTYKSMKDIINVAREGKGLIPRCDKLLHDVIVFPIRYDKKIALDSGSIAGTYPTQIRVSTHDDKPMSGEWATMTFYTEIED